LIYIILSYTVSKLGPFYETQCTYTYTTLNDAVVREIKLLAATYLLRFKTCVRNFWQNLQYLAYASRLERLGVLN